jgi:hypothetical protein
LSGQPCHAAILAAPGLSPLAGKPVQVTFDAGRLTSDGGILMLAEIGPSLGIAGRLARCIEDPRAPERVRHGLAEMIRFRALLIAAGYEDANDCDALRADPAFKIAVEARTRCAGRGYPAMPSGTTRCGSNSMPSPTTSRPFPAHAGVAGRACPGLAHNAAREAGQDRRPDRASWPYLVFQLAEVAVARALFAEILRRIDRLRLRPPPRSA